MYQLDLSIGSPLFTQNKLTGETSVADPDPAFWFHADPDPDFTKTKYNFSYPQHWGQLHIPSFTFGPDNTAPERDE